jgi:hypothetical protein
MLAPLSHPIQSDKAGVYLRPLFHESTCIWIESRAPYSFESQGNVNKACQQSSGSACLRETKENRGTGNRRGRGGLSLSLPSGIRVSRFHYCCRCIQNLVPLKGLLSVPRHGLLAPSPHTGFVFDTRGYVLHIGFGLPILPPARLMDRDPLLCPLCFFNLNSARSRDLPVYTFWILQMPATALHHPSVLLQSWHHGESGD